MEKQNASLLLNEKIREKELERTAQRILLKEQLKITMEKLKPINLIKSTLSSPDLQSSALDAAIGMTSGFIAKKAVVGFSHNPFLKFVGAILQVGVTNLVSRNPETIKSIGGFILKKIFAKKEIDSEKL